MASPDRENNINPEQGEVRKDAYVVFQSRLHSPFNLQSSIDMGILPIEMAHMFAFSLYLDEMRTKYTFGIDTESHNEETVRKITDIVRQSSDINQESSEYWNRGQFTQALESHKRQIHTAHQATSLREPDILKDLEEKTRELVQEKKGGGLFVFFGAAHAPIVDSLRVRMGDANVGYEIKKTGLEVLSHEFASYDSLIKGKPVSDEMHARHLFESLMTTGIEQLCMENGRIANYMLNYETLARTISSVATSFSFDEIQELSRSRKNVLDFLRAHPSSAPLLPYISRLLI